MAFLKPSHDWTRCEQCAVHFNLADGGVCRSCGRILCDTHLYGSWAQRLRRHIGAPATCVDCRARVAHGDPPRPPSDAEPPPRDASPRPRSG